MSDPIMMPTEMRMGSSRMTTEMVPDREDIPDEFKHQVGHPGTWVQFAQDWFNRGISEANLYPKDGIKKIVALSHLREVLNARDIDHGYKIAAVAFLLSEWFESVEWKPGASIRLEGRRR